MFRFELSALRRLLRALPSVTVLAVAPPYRAVVRAYLEAR